MKKRKWLTIVAVIIASVEALAVTGVLPPQVAPVTRAVGAALDAVAADEQPLLVASRS